MCSSVLYAFCPNIYVPHFPVYSKAVQYFLTLWSTPRGPPARKSSHYLYIGTASWSVCLSDRHQESGRRFSLFRFTSLTPIWLWHCDTQFPPMGTGIQIIPDSESFPGIRVWDPQFPPNGYRYPNHPRLRIIPGIPDSLDVVDTRLPSGIPWDIGFEATLVEFCYLPVSRCRQPKFKIQD